MNTEEKTVKVVYENLDAMCFIKNKFPWIPMWIIRRVLFANDKYMEHVGIINWNVELSDWCSPSRKYRKKWKL